MRIERIFPEEGKVYECLLVTRLNITPIGVIREGRYLKFKIFEGKSFEDLEIDNSAIIQVVDDPELLVAIAFNIFPKLELEKAKVLSIKKIKGYPWIEGKVECKEIKVVDELGESRAKLCRFIPLYIGTVKKIPRPISRADNILLELGVLGTRILVARKRGLNVNNLVRKAKELYETYLKLGGKSEIGEEIFKIIKGG
ncbi:hypothetical protein PNA2_1908 [Pyrococcus sp. NA2]|uniref:DUF447 domain-containing protein n=1 Tax=Pyrococcus sp. (strain NA2) TaxID=342949 RepID=UPI000209AD7F|nr:DUF447 domain-containing protein [Pyrococcus sp. NA2]AEC52821.1 hypothetical protein PNA2_1908 [Pyrococcus sp. NA2]